MNENDFLRSVGGRPTTMVSADPTSPASIMWNFGVTPVTPAVTTLYQSKPTFHQAFPKLVGKWDGKSTVNHWLAAQKVLGDKVEDLIQQQPRGSCGGRAGSAAGDFIQCILIASGKQAKFHRVSHAALYFMARKLYGMNNGDWRDDNNDGVAGGSIPEAMKKLGVVQREECGDTTWYGSGSDDLACQLGANMHPDIQSKILQAGSDSLVTDWFPVKSAAELADAIASGCVGLGSDMQGFSMVRDRDGFCKPSGTWSHYQIRVGVGVWNSRPGFCYAQSWGKNSPSGTLLAGAPSNCFGVDLDVQDRIIQNGEWVAVAGWDLDMLEEDKVEISWMF